MSLQLSCARQAVSSAPQTAFLLLRAPRALLPSVSRPLHTLASQKPLAPGVAFRNAPAASAQGPRWALRTELATRSELKTGAALWSAPRLWMSSAVPKPEGDKPAKAEAKPEDVQYWEEGAKKPSELLNPPTPLADRIKQGLASFSKGVVSFAQGCYDMYQHPEKIKPALSHFWSHMKDELKTYWQGTKLLWGDIKTASNLVYRVLQGHTLTRRERRQLIRTASDLFRLVPFALFVIIPFMELLLPVALKLFPNMLPSTFTSQHKREEDLKRQLQLRLHLASFLQDTMANVAQKRLTTGKDKDSAEQLLKLIEQVRQGKRVTNDDLYKLAKLFSDDITLDNSGRVQLVNMCKYMGLNPYGTDSLLRYQLRRQLQKIKEDDLAIRTEGLDSLSYNELVGACRTRGMRTTGLTMAGYKRNLKQWLELSLDYQVPATLLIMSRALAIQENPTGPPKHQQPAAADDHSTGLADALSQMDEEVIEEMLVESGLHDSNLKLEVLERQNQLIAEEHQEEQERQSLEVEKKQKREEILQKLLEKEKAEKAEKEAAKVKAEPAPAEKKPEAPVGQEAEKPEPSEEKKPEPVVEKKPEASSAAEKKPSSAAAVEKKSSAEKKPEASAEAEAPAPLEIEEDVSLVMEERRRHEARDIERKIDADMDQIVDDIAIMVSTSALMEEREMLQAERKKYEARLRQQADKMAEALAADALAATAPPAQPLNLSEVLRTTPEFSAAQAELREQLRAKQARERGEADQLQGFDLPMPSDAEVAAFLAKKRLGAQVPEPELLKSLAEPVVAAAAEKLERLELAGVGKGGANLDEFMEAEAEAKRASRILREAQALGRVESQLDAQLRKMLKQIEVEIEVVDATIGDKLRLLDDKTGQGRISFEELTQAVKTHLKSYPTDEEAARVVHRLRDLCEMDDPPFLRGIKRSISVEDVRRVFREADDRLAKRKEEVERLAREEEEERELKKQAAAAAASAAASASKPASPQ